MVIAAVIASIWYIPNGAKSFSFIAQMNDIWAQQRGLDLNLFSFNSLSFYPLIISSQVSIYLSILLIIGIIYLYKTEHKLLLSASLLIPIFVLIFLSNKDYKWIFPLVPFIAIISVYWLNYIEYRKRMILICIILLVGFINIVSVFGSNPPENENWRHDEVIDIILSDARNDPLIINRGYAYIVFITDHPFVNFRTYEYYIFKRQLPFITMGSGDIGIEGFKNNFLLFDYIITKELQETWEVNLVQMQYFKENQQNYLLLTNLTLPDGTDMSIYKRKR